ncbi:amino-acid N-acetyltransferase [Georgenia faecalis]|uniref:Amino-acid N-acetyltransferase n=1 Tax=Georgenia faecalis TaxID=2483799 RepID=A0ABV9D717_9MICO|nr:amino-acid N-acetyltransferase [Georgenia faecalis]
MSSSGAGPSSAEHAGVRVRQALPADARRIQEIVTPYAADGILITKDLITYFESIQEFVVAEVRDGDRWVVAACGALHVLWDDIGEVRTLAVDRPYLRRGVGQRVLTALLERAGRLGLQRLFCLTFEVDFFRRNGFHVIEGTPVGTDVYAEMLRSHDDGVAEFLDLARVKPNTLGNTRMLLEL